AEKECGRIGPVAGDSARWPFRIDRSRLGGLQASYQYGAGRGGPTRLIALQTASKDFASILFRIFGNDYYCLAFGAASVFCCCCFCMSSVHGGTTPMKRA